METRFLLLACSWRAAPVALDFESLRIVVMVTPRRNSKRAKQHISEPPTRTVHATFDDFAGGAALPAAGRRAKMDSHKSVTYARDERLRTVLDLHDEPSFVILVTHPRKYVCNIAHSLTSEPAQKVLDSRLNGAQVKI